MKKLFTIVSMTLIIPALTSCGGGPKGDMPWIVDRFDDIKVIRYEVPGFEQLPLEEKELIYYLAEATKCGRDILFDQNFKYNLAVRRTLETVYENYEGDRTTAEWKALEKYLKKVWFANGIHHHYSNDKFVPEFTEGYLLDAIETIPEEKFGSLNSLRGEVCRAIFDPALYPTKLNQKAGDDLLLTSSSNYYHNVSQAEAEAFYADMAAADHGDALTSVVHYMWLVVFEVAMLNGKPLEGKDVHGVVDHATAAMHLAGMLAHQATDER